MEAAFFFGATFFRAVVFLGVTFLRLVAAFFLEGVVFFLVAAVFFSFKNLSNYHDHIQIHFNCDNCKHIVN